MRTTIDLPDNLITEAMNLTGLKTKSGTVQEALKNLIAREKIKGIKKYRGKINLDIDLDASRKR